MPEYLAPGVYIEETSYRAKSIEGVATSTTGFVGPCSAGPTSGPAKLVTSFDEFTRTFGDIEDLNLDGKAVTNHMGFAARYFFENGGKRLYVARVFRPRSATDDGVARKALSEPTGVSFKARSPGLSANNLVIRLSGTRTQNVLLGRDDDGLMWSPTLRTGDLVEISEKGRGARFPAKGEAVDLEKVWWIKRDADGKVTLHRPGVDFSAPATLPVVQRLTITLTISGNDRRDTVAGLSTHPDSDNYIGAVLRADDPPNPASRIALSLPSTFNADATIELLKGLVTDEKWELSGGNDGSTPSNREYSGQTALGEIPTGKDAFGLTALEEVEDIAIVGAPGSGDLADAQSIRNALLSHCERLHYRFAILSASQGTNTTDLIRDVRMQHDSTYGALYYPWVKVPDPFGDAASMRLLSPEGFVAGIYARSDNERGVHKAPANEIVRGALDFSVPISHGTQEVLNPEGINCLRFFEGRGNRVWGARTVSSDPEWKYLNVRRLFIYLEHSIDKSTQWAVFEPNNETLWKKVTLTIESFLTDVWRTGALMGTSPKDAFFVRCDRTTMTQGDLDNGRMVCLIGVAPTKPAEFVIFRIGQWTAEASIL